MGFRIIAGQLRFPSGNSDAWTKTDVDLLGFREKEESTWPSMSRDARSEVTMIRFDTAQAVKSERIDTVAEHLERARELTSSGEVRITPELVEWRVRTRTVDPEHLASFRYALCFCYGAGFDDVSGELLMLEGRRTGDRYKRTFILQLSDRQVQTWTPARSLERKVIAALGDDTALPDLQAPPEARLR